MDLNIQLQGTSPLLMHNSQLIDPDNEVAQAMARISSKRKKTPEDRAEMSRLEFWGGLILEDGAPVIPLANVIRCLAEAAKIRRLGKTVERALAMRTISAPLVFDGPQDMASRFEHGEPYVDKRAVTVGTSRIMRTRPKFPNWSLTADFILQESVLALDDLVDIVETAGAIEGLGDARRIGLGRFTAKVKVIE